MKGLAKINSKFPGFYLVFFAIAAVGIYLRLDQFILQVLLDDEWHVIHQLLAKTPKELVQTFGLADFSIPLALLYWLELKLLGLSELGMRWPMMFAGITALILLPLYVRRYYGDRVTLIFLFLLAISPRLIIYSRTARPYALTLLLSLLAVGLFERFVRLEKPSVKIGFFYVMCAISSVWLHLISLPLVVAPFLCFGIPALYNGNWNRVRRIFWLGLVTLAGLLAVVLPPVLGHPEALSVRLGVQLPDFQSFYGILYVWSGTASLSVVLVCLLLATVGTGSLWRGFPLSASLITGLGLTLGIILLTQPAWVQYPVTLARYLLPAIPLFLLAIALGISWLSDMLTRSLASAGKPVSSVILLTVFLLMVYYSPLTQILAKPNSNSLHSVYQFDFRQENNLIYQYQKDFPISPFWQKLSGLPADSIKIAAGPFSFETHHWDAARWEQQSHQRVMPAYLTGFCTDSRWGEVPKGQGYSFKNVGYLSDQDDLIERGFDLVVFQKPKEVLTNQGNKEFGKVTANCEAKLREQFPVPVYEDEWLLVVPLSDNIRGLINAAQ